MDRKQTSQIIHSLVNSPKSLRTNKFSKKTAVQRVFCIFIAHRFINALKKRDAPNSKANSRYIKLIGKMKFDLSGIGHDELAKAYKQLGLQLEIADIQCFFGRINKNTSRRNH